MTVTMTLCKAAVTRLAAATNALSKVTTPEGERWITVNGRHVLVADKSGGGSSGGGSSESDTGGYAYGTPAHQKNWVHLSENEKQDRMGELWLRVANIANNGSTPEARENAKKRLARWNELTGNKKALEQSMAAYHEAQRANTAKPSSDKPSGDKPSELGLVEPVAGSTKAKIATASKQVADISRTAAQVLDAIVTMHGGGEESNTARILGTAGAIAGGVTALAAAFHLASKAGNTGTMLTALNTAHEASKTLRGSLPSLMSVVKSPSMRSSLRRLTTKLSSLENNLAQTKLGTTVARAAFSATGGTIIPAPPYRPPITTVLPKTFRTGARYQPYYTKPTRITMTPPRLTSNITYKRQQRAH